RVIAAGDGFGGEVERAIAAIVGTRRDPALVAAEVRAMRTMIAKEKGDADPWDLKLAAGGLTDLDFIAQAITLAEAARHPSLIGLATPAVFAEAANAGLLDEADTRQLGAAHALFNDIFQWQRLTIEGPFDAATVSPAILQRLAAAVGRPNAAVLLEDLNETRHGVRVIFARVLQPVR
ncbi:MAG TPA: bifunctional [glutamine synthetase] adenylyltransferase/[glutamine synthetase]-adenylyl-L-tyrosine phosphorylase, partial [Beijerinckiaceae bacterium]|nr:bifunctional [glutamine synthetase] adenylyltransferase/[glutamine synthetase]-adenylyl-L-tyrosine phosphorylase [Beijerinckiaceae bacterium]